VETNRARVSKMLLLRIFSQNSNFYWKLSHLGDEDKRFSTRFIVQGTF